MNQLQIEQVSKHILYIIYQHKKKRWCNRRKHGHLFQSRCRDWSSKKPAESGGPAGLWTPDVGANVSLWRRRRPGGNSLTDGRPSLELADRSGDDLNAAALLSRNQYRRRPPDGHRNERRAMSLRKREVTFFGTASLGLYAIANVGFFLLFLLMLLLCSLLSRQDFQERTFFKSRPNEKNI